MIRYKLTEDDAKISIRVVKDPKKFVKYRFAASMTDLINKYKYSDKKVELHL